MRADMTAKQEAVSYFRIENGPYYQSWLTAWPCWRGWWKSLSRWCNNETEADETMWNATKQWRLSLVIKWATFFLCLLCVSLISWCNSLHVKDYDEDDHCQADFILILWIPSEWSFFMLQGAWHWRRNSFYVNDYVWWEFSAVQRFR